MRSVKFFYLLMLIPVMLISQISIAQNILSVGSDVPEFEVTDSKGKVHSLSDYKSQGKYVLVKFSFITCGACHIANRPVNYIYTNFGCNEKDLVVIGVDPVYNDEQVNNYWDIIGPSTTNDPLFGDKAIYTPQYPEITTDGGALDMVNIFKMQNTGYPSYFLISPEGKVVSNSDFNDGMYGGLSIYFGGSVVTIVEEALFTHLKSLGLFSYLPYFKYLTYYKTKVLPNEGADNLYPFPYSEYCSGDVVVDQTECDLVVPEVNVKVTIFPEELQTIVDSLTIFWTEDPLCSSYFISLLRSDTYEEVKTAEATSSPHGLYVTDGEYIVTVQCDCNEDLDVGVSDDFLVGTIVESDADLTNENCEDICVYTLDLWNNGSTNGGVDWQNIPFDYGVEIASEGNSSLFWLQSGVDQKSFSISMCKGSEADLTFFGNGLLFGIAAYSLSDSYGNVVFKSEIVETDSIPDFEPFSFTYTTTVTCEAGGTGDELIASFKGSNVVCQGASIDFVSTSQGDVTSYEWEFEGAEPASSTEKNPSVTYNDVGLFDVTLTVNDAQGNTNTFTSTTHVTVLAQPTIVITENNPVSEVGNADGSIIVEVFDGIGPYEITATDGNNSYTAIAGKIENLPIGNYSLTASNNNASCEASTNFEITMSTAIHKAVRQDFSVHITPNPAKDVLYIDFKQKELAFQIYDNTGRLISKGNTTNQISLNSFASGLYFLHLRDNEHNTYITKFVKQ